MGQDVDFFFAIGSPWAYIGLSPMRDLASKSGISFIPRPIRLIEANGAIYSKDRPEARRRYWFTDLARWADRRGKTILLDGRDGLAPPDPAAFMVIAAALDGADWFALTERLQHGFWSERADIGTAETRAKLADEIGLNGARLVAREGDADVRARWDENHAVALTAGVFGSPTFRLGDVLYWGQDSLGFLAEALAVAG